MITNNYRVTSVSRFFIAWASSCIFWFLMFDLFMRFFLKAFPNLHLYLYLSNLWCTLDDSWNL